MYSVYQQDENQMALLLYVVVDILP